MTMTDDALPNAEPRWEAPWLALPDKARIAYRIATLLGMGLPVMGLAGFGMLVMRRNFPMYPLWALLGVVAVLALAWWLGGARHRHTRYRLDEDGLHVARGIWWKGETLVPRTRVQHLDLERGPIERRLGLASLVLHTAGTRLNAVKLAGLDADEARAIRNELVDREADADDDAL